MAWWIIVRIALIGAIQGMQEQELRPRLTQQLLTWLMHIFG